MHPACGCDLAVAVLFAPFEGFVHDLRCVNHQTFYFKATHMFILVVFTIYVEKTLYGEIIFYCVETCNSVKFVLAQYFDMFWDLSHLN